MILTCLTRGSFLLLHKNGQEEMEEEQFKTKREAEAVRERCHRGRKMKRTKGEKIKGNDRTFLLLSEEKEEEKRRGRGRAW